MPVKYSDILVYIKLYVSFLVVFTSILTVIYMCSVFSLYWLIPVINFPISVFTYKYRHQESIFGGLALATVLGGIYGIFSCVIAYVV